MRSCLAAAALGAVLIAGLALAWLNRAEVGRFASRLLGREAVVTETAGASPELSRQAEAKIVALGQGQLEEAVLTAAELDSWVRYGLEGYFPGYVSSVSAGLEGDLLVLSGRLAMKEVPGVERLGFAAAMFGDTADVAVRGRVDGVSAGRGIFRVEEVRVGAVTLPAGLRDQLLVQLKGRSMSDLPANAVAFELPEFVTDVAVRESQLVLRSALPEP